MKLAILDDYQNAALASADWASLAPRIDVKVFNTHLGHDESAVAAALEPFDILIAMRERTPFPASQLDRLPNLKLLVTTGMRNLAIDMDHARGRGVDVCGTSILAYPAAEHAMALIMDVTKKISAENRAMHEGGWQQVVAEGLNGKTLGVLGLGRLGAKLAAFGNLLEMDVIAWSENLTQQRCEEVGVRLVDRETLFREADILTIHMLLSDRSRGMVGASELATMKSGAYLINTSRGPIVDEAALVSALQNKTIAGAGLDVFDVEPLPSDHALRRLDNAVLTGHTGYVVKEFFELVYPEAVEDVKSWLEGKPERLLNGA